jgi:hypothetical protein
VPNVGFVPALRAAIVIAALTASSPLAAQTAPRQAATNKPMPYAMTVAEYQGMGCLAEGSIGGLGAHLYSDVVAIALSGTANPALGIPFVVSGFAIGCGIGASASPALHYIYRLSFAY